MGPDQKTCVEPQDYLLYLEQGKIKSANLEPQLRGTPLNKDYPQLAQVDAFDVDTRVEKIFLFIGKLSD